MSAPEVPPNNAGVMRAGVRRGPVAAVLGPPIVTLAEFDPAVVEPRNALPQVCPECVGCPCWPWMYDYTGTFGADGILDPGESSAPLEWVLFDPGQASFSFRAHVRVRIAAASGLITGRVFADADGDGGLYGDQRIPGVTVYLHHGDVSTSTVTGVAGRFDFSVTEAGLYEVEREPVIDCRPTTPLRRQVVIVRRADGSLSGYDQADFGCRPEAPVPIPVHGVVFEDRDRDGERDVGEPGIAGLGLTGTVPQCPTSAPVSGHTGPDGEYVLLMRPCLPYVIVRDDRPGFVGTTPNPVVIESAMPNEQPPPPDPYIANFGLALADSDPTQTFQLVGQVYRDANRNGARDSGELGVPSARVGIEPVGSIADFGHVLTDANGFYHSDAGAFPPRTGWRVTADDRLCTSTPRTVALPANGVHQVDFASVECNIGQDILVSGVVWFDQNRNSIRDPEDHGIQDAVVQLLSACGERIEVWTDATGHYDFSPGSIPCRVHAVFLARPQFWSYTTPRMFEIPANPPPGTRFEFDFGVFAIHHEGAAPE